VLFNQGTFFAISLLPKLPNYIPTNSFNKIQIRFEVLKSFFYVSDLRPKENTAFYLTTLVASCFDRIDQKRCCVFSQVDFELDSNTFWTWLKKLPSL